MRHRHESHSLCRRAAEGKPDYGNSGPGGQGRHSSQQIIGGFWVHTITQQHLAASTSSVVAMLNAAEKIAAKTKMATSTLSFLNAVTSTHLLPMAKPERLRKSRSVS